MARSSPMRALLSLLLLSAPLSAVEPIDREALVRRHNPTVRSVDPDASFAVGNGGFAFGADITGLQTFADHHHRFGVPVETLSRWAWYSETNPQNYTLADASKPFTRADGRIVEYPTLQSSPAGEWLRRNPRSHPLGQLAFERIGENAVPITVDEIQRPEQSLDMWRGIIESRFILDEVPVKVTTVCHPELDLVAVRVESELLDRLAVRLAFPRGHDASIKNTPPLDWSEVDSHTTETTHRKPQRVDLLRRRDAMSYHATLAWRGKAEWVEKSPHAFLLKSGGNTLEFTLAFSPGKLPDSLPSFDETHKASSAQWIEFWNEGAAVDFSGSTDPRAATIERRILLSRYLMATQCAGDVPPQESGLTCNTWYGKHHTEMIW